MSGWNAFFQKRLLAKPAIFLLLVFSLLAVSYSGIDSAISAENPELKVTVNGRPVFFTDAKPFIDENGRTQVPARFIAEELGARVSWNQENKTAYIDGHGKLIALVPGQKTATVNGETVLLDTAAALIQDRIFVPVRFIAETLVSAVNWDQYGWTANISLGLPIIKDFGISHVKEESGWYTVPRTFTARVAAENTERVDFYLTPTGTGQTPVKIATSEGNGEQRQNFSITYRLPEESTLAHFWAVAVNDKGQESTAILNIYREIGPEPPGSIDGIPMHPSFFWSEELDQAAREELKCWLSTDYDQTTGKVILSSWLQNPVSNEIINWYREELEKLGWKVLSLAGGSTHWCTSAEKDGRSLRVNYAWGSGDRGTEAPSDPEKGYRLAAVVTNHLNFPVEKTADIEKLSLTGYNQDLHFLCDGERVIFSGYSYDGSGDISSSLILADFRTGSAVPLDEGKFMRILDLDVTGKKILYMKDGSLWCLSLAGGEKVKIAEDTFCGSFSPDGCKVAFAQQGAGLWVADRDDGNKKRLTSSTEDWYPVWYLDGRHLFFFSDLGIELGDGADHLQGMARINTADGSIEKIIPEKTGKFRKAEWIVPGSSLHVVSGWDDGYYEHIVDLVGNKINDLGENFNQANYVTAVDQAGGRFLKTWHGGLIEIYDAAGKLVRSFDLGHNGQQYFHAAYATDGHNVLLVRGNSPESSEPQEIKLSVFNPENGSYSSAGNYSENIEACFWSPADGQIIILERGTGDNIGRLSAFFKVDAGSSVGAGEEGFNIFTLVQESDLSSEERSFIDEVRMTRGIYHKGDLYVAALGEKPNPGYGIELVKTELIQGQLKVYVKLTKPEPGKMYAAVITYPYLAGRVSLSPFTKISFIDIETGENLF